MRGVAVFFTLVLVVAVLAAVSAGIYYYFRRKRNVLILRESCYPSSSYNTGATQTRQFHRLLPPPPSRSQSTSARTRPSPHAPPREPRLPTTLAGVWSNSNSNSPASARSKIAPKTPPAPPDYDSDLYRSSVVHPPVRRTQLSSNHTRPSSHVAPRVHSGSEPTPPTIVQVISPDIHSDEPTTVEDLDSAKKLREQARRQGREMTEARSRAKSAQKKGRRGAADAHRQEALVHKSAKEKLDKRAAKIIFKEKNKNRKEGGMIDLHGLLVTEAIEFAKEELQSAKSRGDEVVRFIVGKGLHAEDGVAKIRPALEAFCTKRGLSNSLDPKNGGVLIVRLDDQ